MTFVVEAVMVVMGKRKAMRRRWRRGGGW